MHKKTNDTFTVVFIQRIQQAAATAAFGHKSDSFTSLDVLGPAYS